MDESAENTISSTNSGIFEDEIAKQPISSTKQTVYEDEPQENEKPAPKGWLVFLVDYTGKNSNLLEELRKVKEFIKSIDSQLSTISQ